MYFLFLVGGVKSQKQCPRCICLVPRGSRAPWPSTASLQRRSPLACTSAPPPQTECGRRGRWAVVPGSASETRGLKPPPWPEHPRGDSPRQGGRRGARVREVLGVDWSGSWGDGGVGELGDWSQGPRVRGRFFIGEVKRRWAGGSVGSVKGQADLSSPGDGPPPHAGPCRRKMDLAVKYAAVQSKQ